MQNANANGPLVGPIQLVVIGFPRDAQFRGEIIRALSEVRGHGTIRLIDALFVRKDDQGRTSASMRESDLTLHERETLGAIAGGLLGLMTGGDEESEALGATEAAQAIAHNAFGLGIGDLQKVTERIEPGHSALLLLFEHTWALDLKGAVRGAGGVPLVEGFLTPEALFMMGAEVQAVTEAENTIARAEAARGIAILDAIATIEVAEEVQQAAVAETARVLIAAGLIEAAAAQEVVDALVEADLIKEWARADAAAATEQHDQELRALKEAQAVSPN